MSLILKPFSLLLTFFYTFFQSYGVALILFALVVKVVLFPFSLKGKKSMVRMNMVQGKAARLQKQYANNRQKQQEELAKLYEKEQVNPMGGCLWSFLPLLFLFPLYAIIRQPLLYMMDMTVEQIVTVGNTVLHWADVCVQNGWAKAGTDMAKALTESTAGAGYNQLYLASLITPANLAQVQAIAPKALAINFEFLGMNLAQVPTWRVWEHPLTWNNIGLALMPIISALLSLLMSVVTQKTNNMSNPNAAQQSGSTNMMLYVMSPLMSLWIGYVMPAGLCVYWIINSLLSMVQEVISGRLLKKDYEEAAEAARKQALLDKEEEKRRKAALSAERAKRAEEKKQKGKKKDKSKESAGVDVTASRVGIRAYARGRAYDPARYGEVTPYRDPDGAIDEDAVEQARAAKEERAEEARLEAEVTAQVAAEVDALAQGTAEDVEKRLEQIEEAREQESAAQAEAEAEALAAQVTGRSPEEPDQDGELTPAPRYDAPDYHADSEEEK